MGIGRLARKQLLWILVFSSFVTLMSTAIQLLIEYRTDTAFIHEQFELVKNAHLDSLTRSVWKFDEKQIETQLDSILSLRDIVAIEVIENTGSSYFRGERTPRHRTESILLDMVFLHDGEDEQLGTVELTASFEGVYQRLRRRILVILSTQAMKTFLVSFFILYVINHLVMRHLATIATYAIEIQSATLGRSLSLKRKPSATLAEDELDKVVSSINVMRQRLQDDIVAQKKIEKSLRESEEKYRAIFENAVEGFFQSTPEGRFISVNPAFARMFGYSSPEDVLETIVDIEKQFYVHAVDRERYQQAIDATGVIENFEFMAKQKDGTPLWICNNTRCYFDEDGKVIRYEGTVTDIQSRKVAEKEQERLQLQLVKAQKMESIGNLAGGIAHDFNNILSAIMGYTELSLIDAEKGSALEKNLTGVRKASERARDLVKQILAFARQTDEQFNPVHVKSIAQEALKFIRSTIPSTIEVRQSLESDSLIRGNSTHINQIFMNICTNAAHSMEAFGGVLEVALRDVELSVTSSLVLSGLQPGNYLQIIISDTGEGIKPEIAEHIFEPYFTTKNIGEGTGMGLAIVHGIVEAYGGRIELKSVEHEGATFFVYLPISKEMSASAIPVKSDVLPKGNEAILFVDDEAAITTTTGRMLELLGYRVTVQTDSISALELFRSSAGAFDLVITDMNMPFMTGDVLATKIRATRPDIPVILCTGFSKKITEQVLVKSGVYSCINKPVSKTELAHAVREALDKTA
jgi:PAS domain S-box-containing protein